MLSKNLFGLNQVEIFCNSFCILLKGFSFFYPTKQISIICKHYRCQQRRSHTEIINIEAIHRSHTEIINIDENEKRPGINPCGTPNKILCNVVFLFWSKEIHYFLLIEQIFNSFRQFTFTLQVWSLVKTMSWLTVWNAFDRYTDITRTNLPFQKTLQHHVLILKQHDVLNGLPETQIV